MDQQEIKQEIRRLATERNALILAHNYQRDEIQELADITGDSLGLSLEAAKTDREVIVFCGVHFMAESAAILAPDKMVLLPRPDAGCPMADMVTAEGLRALKAQHPGATGGHLCQLQRRGQGRERYLLHQRQRRASGQLPRRRRGDPGAGPQPRPLHRPPYHKTCYFWDGYCPTHERLQVADVERALAEHPDALFMAHPECAPEILDLAHHICSTSGMYDYVGEEPGAEVHRRHRGRHPLPAAPGKPGQDFVLPTSRLICPNMKLTSLEDVLHCLQTMSPQITVPPAVAAPRPGKPGADARRSPRLRRAAQGSSRACCGTPFLLVAPSSPPER